MAQVTVKFSTTDGTDEAIVTLLEAIAAMPLAFGLYWELVNSPDPDLAIVDPAALTPNTETGTLADVNIERLAERLTKLENCMTALGMGNGLREGLDAMQSDIEALTESVDEMQKTMLTSDSLDDAVREAIDSDIIANNLPNSVLTRDDFDPDVYMREEDLEEKVRALFDEGDITINVTVG